MRIYNQYIISLILVSTLANIILYFIGPDDIGVFFIVNSLTFLVITLLYAYLNPRARKSLNVIGITVFAGFLVVVSLRALRVISGA